MYSGIIVVLMCVAAPMLMDAWSMAGLLGQPFVLSLLYVFLFMHHKIAHRIQLPI